MAGPQKRISSAHISTLKVYVYGETIALPCICVPPRQTGKNAASRATITCALFRLAVVGLGKCCEGCCPGKLLSRGSTAFLWSLFTPQFRAIRSAWSSYICPSRNTPKSIVLEQFGAYVALDSMAIVINISSQIGSRMQDSARA